METARGTVELRGYTAADFEALFHLDEVCFELPFRFSRAALRRFLEARRARVIVAASRAGGGEIAGFILLHMEKALGGCAGYVVTLDVAPGWRRMGIAGALMRQAEADIAEEGCRSMLLHVYTGNTEALRFYEGLGFARSHTAEAFYGEGLDAFVYRKHLRQ